MAVNKRKKILDILSIQVGATPNDKAENCYEIQPYWQGRLATKLLALFPDRIAVAKLLARIKGDDWEWASTRQNCLREADQILDLFQGVKC